VFAAGCGGAACGAVGGLDWSVAGYRRVGQIPLPMNVTQFYLVRVMSAFR